MLDQRSYNDELQLLPSLPKPRPPPPPLLSPRRDPDSPNSAKLRPYRSPSAVPSQRPPLVSPDPSPTSSSSCSSPPSRAPRPSTSPASNSSLPAAPPSPRRDRPTTPHTTTPTETSSTSPTAHMQIRRHLVLTPTRSSSPLELLPRLQEPPSSSALRPASSRRDPLRRAPPRRPGSPADTHSYPPSPSRRLLPAAEHAVPRRAQIRSPCPPTMRSPDTVVGFFVKKPHVVGRMRTHQCAAEELEKELGVGVGEGAWRGEEEEVTRARGLSGGARRGLEQKRRWRRQILACGQRARRRLSSSGHEEKVPRVCRGAGSRRRCELEEGAGRR